MTAGASVLVVGGNNASRQAIKACLDRAGYAVSAAPDDRDASAPDIVIAAPSKSSGAALLRRMRAAMPGAVLIAVGHGYDGVSATKAGADYCLPGQLDSDALRLLVDKAVEHGRLRREVDVLRTGIDRKYGFHNLVGGSGALLHILDIAVRAAQVDSPVLIRGERGTGKELLAKAIHFNSRRRQSPFIIMDCGAAPHEAIESTLFGDGGPAPGGVPGKVTAARGGTLYLDEISSLPLELQARLLRFLQDNDNGEAANLNVRVIATTRRNLQAMIEDGEFREDLYFRLAVIPLELPPLRDRAEDIPMLAQHFLALSKERHGRAELVLPGGLISRFCSYRWPGNVRELEDVIDRLVLICAGPEITLNDLPEFLGTERTTFDGLYFDLPPRGISLEAVERTLILKALEKCNWNQSQAARYLDLSRKTLIYRMEKFGLRRATRGPDNEAGGVRPPAPSGAAGHSSAERMSE